MFTLGIGGAVFGTSELTTDLRLGSARAINLAVAEYIKDRRPASTSSGSPNASITTGRPGSVISP